MRTHVVLPEELVAEVDKVAGKRGRSKFIADAIETKLRLARQRAAFEAARGMLKGRDDDYPEWSTAEKTTEWVRKLREADNERLARVWGHEV
jgi:hypothetical protein